MLLTAHFSILDASIQLKIALRKKNLHTFGLSGLTNVIKGSINIPRSRTSYLF